MRGCKPLAHALDPGINHLNIIDRFERVIGCLGLGVMAAQKVQPLFQAPGLLATL